MVKLFSKTPSPSPFTQFFGDIALRLQQIDAAAPKPAIEAIMREIGERYALDRVHLRWAPSQDSGSAEFELVTGWQRGDIGPGRVFAAGEVPWILARLRDNRPVRFDNVDELPKEAAEDSLALQARGIQAALIFGLRLDADFVGVFTLSTTSPFAWTDQLQHEVMTLGSLLTDFYWNINNRVRLKESEARYRGVVQDQSDLIFRWTLDGKITWANDSFCKYMGMTHEALVHKHSDWLTSGPNWLRLKDHVAALRADNPVLSDEHEDTLPNGKRVWQEWTDRAIFDDEGKLLEIQSIGRDITDRKLAEAERQREAVFQRHKAELLISLTSLSKEDADLTIRRALENIGNLYGAARIGVWWLSEKKESVTCMHRWFEEGAPQPPFPYTVSRADYQWVFDLLLSGKKLLFRDIDEVPANASELRGFMEKTQIRSYLACPLTVDGEDFGSITIAATRADAWNDNALGELEILGNILAAAISRFHATEALARREKDLERSQQVASVGSYRLKGTINQDDPSQLLEILDVEMSDQALQMFDMEAQEDASAQVLEAISRIHPKDVSRVRDMWRESIEQRGEHIVEYRIVKRDGSLLHVQVNDQLDNIDENGVMTIFGTYKDITQWVESNQALQKAILEIQQLKDRLEDENLMLRDEVRAAHGFETIIGKSEALQTVLRAAAQVAPTDVTVLINGETGTGKELVARSIHESSRRSDKPMVCVNCAALSSDLIESELFGHEKGAFTGAHEQRKGRFEIADGGTLFLDEIGEMSGDLQAKLLRVIQEGEFERLGGTQTLKTNVRLIAATNRDLVAAMDSGSFRADLYYRINAFPLDLPPLRERKEDIPLLAEHLVRKHAGILGKDVTAISARTMRHLQGQGWPGNIRELEGAILRALISTTGTVLDFVDDSGVNNALASNTPDSLNLLDAQRMHIIDVLERTNWVIEGKKGAASALGLAPSSLRSKMKRLNIARPSRARAS
jgi:PAS domain S-box-containing protein